MSIRHLLARLLHRPRPTFREGQIISQFIAADVRRDVLIVSAAQVDQGIVTCRVRTMNLLYVSMALVSEPEFGPPRTIHIDDLWQWTGEDWGGTPDGTSIVDRSHKRPSD